MLLQVFCYSAIRVTARGNVKVLEALLNSNVTVDPLDQSNSTPLLLSAIGGHPEVTQLSLSHNLVCSTASRKGCKCKSQEFKPKVCSSFISNEW